MCLAPRHTASRLPPRITAVSSLLQERYCRREGPQLQAPKAEQRRSHGGQKVLSVRGGCARPGPQQTTVL
ncbi:hypothetical protein CesoFtcFv8_019448 [Champsocephalus esox]|uniref:Uncharacterized protein n=2 Tax=Champsocephalus TaxID=52236 RepID=A0AAN8HC86_CHAGU|nr:hypothetical protein CesoFtcFv8_019448 [Champsocephalus esox]KAK5910714.1 hypothetical protein CgunFtcFv8_004952 [Champsocephalus gunnari]